MSISISKNFYDISIIPKNWTEKRLKNILTISENKSLNFKNEKILSLTKKGIVINDISSNKGQIAESYEKYIKVKKGQICMNPMDLLSGWVDISNFEGLISPAYYTFELNEEVENKFINYFLQSNYLRKTFFKLGKGVASHDNFGRWVLTPEELKIICLFIPNIEEQKLISHYLDNKTENIDKLIDKIQRKIELIKEQRTSLINHCVTKGINPKVKMKDIEVKLIGKIPKHWKLQKLKHIVNKRGLIRGPFGGSLKINTFVPKGYKVYEQKNAIYNNFSLGSAYINDKKYTELKRFSIQQNDILMSCSGTIGKTSLVTGEFQKGIINQALLIIRLEFPKKTLPKYIQTIFSSSFFQEQIIDNSQGGAMKNLVGIDIFKNVKIPIPDSLEQLEIQSYIDSKCLILDKLITKEKLKVEKLKEYRSSLISSLVTGKVRITEDMT